ncbi:hypothetical protein llap_13111 [Limosa lapponica baueri]|uniref:Uncharacterized protein n=1 Tax=Limosa lapponica baueri TaxID=1758121 RepID=A0A2I0TS19_LIMLA|nr:hypothetical protein llap_13111 [Limosa lapponica baueri]
MRDGTGATAGTCAYTRLPENRKPSRRGRALELGLHTVRCGQCPSYVEDPRAGCHIPSGVNPFSTQPVFVPGIAPTHVQDLALNLVIFMRFAWAHLSSLSRPLCMASLPSSMLTAPQLGVISNLAEGVLNPTVHVADKDVKQHQSQYRPLRNTTHHWSPLGHQAIDRNSLSATIHPIPYPPSGPSVKSMSLQFRDKDIMWDRVKCFAQVQVDDTSCSSLIHQRCNLTVEDHQIYQAQFAFSEAMLTVTSHLLVFQCVLTVSRRICSMISLATEVRLIRTVNPSSPVPIRNPSAAIWKYKPSHHLKEIVQCKDKS